MESARHYGADVEKRASGSSSAEYDADLLSRNALEQQQRSGRRGVRWLAVLAVVGLTTVTMFHGGRVYSAAEKAIGRAKHRSGAQLSPSFEDIAARQSGSNSTQHYGTLEPMALNPLPLGSIQGLGWLGAEMDNLANGLAGHEMDFFPVVSQNPWIGGQIDYSELLEGYPYWLNGLVPLAYQTNNDRLKQQVLGSVKYVLAQQNQTDGMIGPVRFGNSLDIWSRFPLLLGLRNLADADSTMTAPIVSAMHKFLPRAYSLLGDGQLVATNEAWARSRYADFLLTLQWLFENHPTNNGADNRGLIWQTMVRMRDIGIDWAGYYTPQSYYFQDIDDIPISTSDGSFHFPFLHGVNVGQGLKTMAVDWRFTHNDSLLPVQRDAVEWTLKYHGAPSGTVIGDERESGLAPNRGSELCTAVETMFSMHTIYAITGENAYADHAEMAAFNALPVMLTNNAWAHQYIAPPNLPYAAPLQGNAVFWNVGDFGTTYGTSPNYPCCAVNHPQGFPKFTQATFMSVGNDGLAHVLLAPAQATTKLGNGANVKVAANTDYPFSDILTYSITSDKPFTFYVRVPTWASSPSMTVNGKQGVVTAGANGLSPVSVGSGTTTVQFVLKSALRTVERANDTIAVYRGALLYALDVGQVNTSTPGSADITRNLPPGGNADVEAALSYYHNVSIEPTNLPAGARDYNMSNTKAWNFALDETTLRFFSYNGSSKTGDAVNHTSTVMQQGESASGDASGKTPSLAIPIFGYQAPSMYVTAQACQVDWSLLGGIPFRPPLKGDRQCLGKSVEIVMRPYGSLNLHMSQLPTVDLSGNKTSSS